LKKRSLIAISIIIFIILIISIVLLNRNKKTIQEDNKFKIVTSFHPIYVMALNLGNGAENIEIVNMTENHAGCLHNHTLSTSDMKKIENADVFIQNGLNLEEFMEDVLEKYPKLKVIDSSENITNTIKEENEINPHIWTSIENYKKQTQNICNKLCEYNPENEEIYKTNCNNYLKQINDVKQKYVDELQKLKGKKAIVLNEALTYLAKELQMDVIQIKTDHEESTMSAETLKNLIEKMKNENINIIFVSKEEENKNALTISNETNSKIYELETGLTGEEKVDSYLKVLNNNLEVLKSINN